MEKIVWVVFEINHVQNYEKLASIQDTQELANDIADFYRSKLKNQFEIEYIVQSWIVLENIETLKNAETIDLSSEQENN